MLSSTVSSALPPAPATAAAHARRAYFVAAVLLGSAMLRLFVVARGGALYWTDEKRYYAAREAAAAIVAGDWPGAGRFLFSSSEHIGFRWLTLPPAFLERALYGDDPPHARWCAGWLALFSVANLLLIWRIARAGERRAGEAEWALAFAACSNSLFYFSRHCFPYDAALACFLVAAYFTVRPPTRWTPFAVGAACGTGYLIYNGYWSVGAVACLSYVAWRSAPLRTRVVRAGAALIALTLPVVVMYGLARVLGYHLLADSLRFAGTVNQGDFGGGARLIGEYLWTADRGLPLILAALVGVAVVPLGFDRVKGGESMCSPWVRWAAASIALIAIWIFLSDVRPTFVLYGRTVRAVVPFVALAAGGAMAALCERAGVLAKRTLIVMAIGICVAGASAMLQPLRQQFPAEFRIEAEARIAALRQREPAAEFRTAFADYLYNPPQALRLPPHVDILRRAHPHQYRPYLYEGYGRAQRPQFLSPNADMRLVQLDRSHGLDRFEYSAGAAWLDPYPGLLLMNVRFPKSGRGTERLLEHGTGDAQVSVWVTYVGDTNVRFSLVRAGQPSVSSPPLACRVNPDHSLLLSLESFYPADVADRANESAVAALRARSRVIFDGISVIDATLGCPPMPVGALRIGAATAKDGVATSFSGDVLMVRQLDPTRAASDKWIAGAMDAMSIGGPFFGANHGPLELTLRFPAGLTGRSQTLVAAGTPAIADQLFVSYVDPRHIRFGLDHWGDAPLMSEAVAIDPSAEQHLVVSLGALFPGQDDGRYEHAPELRFLERWLYVKIGETVVFSRPFDFFPCAPDTLTVGRTAVGSSNADPAFTGQILAVRHCSPSELGLAEQSQAWPPASRPPDSNAPLGRIRLTLRLPAQWQAGREPFIVSGVYPNCEMVYARYVGSDRLQLGYRQGTLWPILSEPFVVTPGSTHTVEVSLPSLALTRSPTEAKIGIRFDDRQLINESARVIAVAPDALYFGHFTGVVKLFRMRFTGEIVRAEFPDSESVSHLGRRSRTATAVP